MGNISVTELSVPIILPKASLAYKNESFINEMVFPRIDNVDSDFNLVKFHKAHAFKTAAGPRAPGTEANEKFFSGELINITMHENAVRMRITHKDREVNDREGGPKFALETMFTEMCSNDLDLAREIFIADIVKDTAWGIAGDQVVDVGGAWANPTATNTFNTDMIAAIDKMRERTGVRPNRFLMATKTRDVIVDLAVMALLVEPERGKLGDESLIKTKFRLDQVLIGDAMYSDTKITKDPSADDLAFVGKDIWDKNGKGMGFLYYAPNTPMREMPSVGYQVRGKNGAGYKMARDVRRWPEPAIKSEFIEVSENFDAKVCDSTLGYRFENCLEA